MKKPKRLRAISGVASAALLASYLLPLGEIPPALTARAADDDRPVYAKEITPEQLLTDFNLFIEENVTATNQGHIVGSVIIGDTLDTPNAFGDGAITSSYIHHIKNLINIAKPGDWIEDPELKEQCERNNYVYYHINDNEYPNLPYMQQIADDCEYVPIKNAFAELRKWSSEQKESDSAYKATADNINTEGVLTLDVDANRNIVIPKDVYDAAKAINLVSSSLEGIMCGKNTITIADVKDVKFAFSGGGEDTKTIQFNGITSETTMKDALCVPPDETKFRDGQLNLEAGMNLIWNLPDADNVDTAFLEGHLVAPKANVNVTGGRFEGGIIAKNANLDAEAHFYPYNSWTVRHAPYSFDLFKYINEAGGEPLPGALFGAFPVSENGVGTNPSFTLKTGDTNPNLFSLDAGKYVIKEYGAPAGYMVSDTEYYIEITENPEHDAVIKLNTWDNAETKTVQYTDKVTVKLYSDPDFTKVIKTAEYSPLALAENLYTVGGKTYAFTVGPDGKVTKAEEVAADGSRTDAELDQFTFNSVDAAYYNVVYDDQTVVPVNGFYEINGDQYEIQIEEDGTVSKITKKGKTLSADEVKRFRLGKMSTTWGPFGGQWDPTTLKTLYYYDKPYTEQGAQILYSAEADENGVYKFADLNQSYIITTEKGVGFGQVPDEVTGVTEADADVTTDMVSTVKTTKCNYIVVIDCSVASAVINVYEKIGPKFEYTDSEAMTLRNVDAAEQDT
ncbi:MAG: choice-of-anchor A family protein, partial [Oscillospiraceae bacterium]|nr:choice-of-anchor A family protein [Oscillospiraceae bacterium]